MFLALPWQVALVVVTVVWLGLWLVLKRGLEAIATRFPVLRRLPARLHARAVEATLSSPESAPYLTTIVGLGIYVPTLLGLSIAYQLRVVSASGGHIDWVAVFVYHALWLGPNHLFFAHVATLVHHLGHQKDAFKPWFRPIGTFIVGALGMLMATCPATIR